jgi:hypothetical protein
MRLKFRTRLVCRCAALVGIAALGSIYVVLGGEFLGSGHAGGAAVPATTGSAGDGASRQLLEVDPLFPTALQGSDKVLLAVYIPLIMYMFLALAIICDEYFVPALEVSTPAHCLPTVSTAMHVVFTYACGCTCMVLIT